MTAATERLRRGFALCALTTLAGCGPITATTALFDASAAIEGAEAVDAPRYAVYEYTSATAYLSKAKEEEGYSDFQAAIDLAKKAQAFADQARARALKNPARGLPPAGSPAEDDPKDAHEPPPTGDDPGSHL